MGPGRLLSSRTVRASVEANSWQQVFKDDFQAAFDAQFVGMEVDFGILRRFVWSIDPC